MPENPAADRARMVGYAVALNGTVATVDLFGSLPGALKPCAQRRAL